MYNMERAQNLGHVDNYCNICPGQVESNKHIFFSCSKTRCKWVAIAIYYKEYPQDSALVDAASIIHIIDGCLSKTPHGIACLSVVYHTCWSSWSQCNDRLYSTRSQQFLVRIIIDQAIEHITMAAQYCKSHKKKQQL